MTAEPATGTDALVVAGYKFGSAMARVMPGPMANASASMLGFTFMQMMRSRRSMVERHMRRVNPSLRGLALRGAVQDAFDSYARYWMESFRLPHLSNSEVDRRFTEDGYRYLLDALDKGNGAIIALAHLGGWEWAGRWIAQRGHGITVVVEPIEPPELFEWFVQYRQELGMTVVPLGPEAGTAVLKALRNNEVVCLLCDRDIGGGGIEVEFFGEKTFVPPGPATMSLRTGAPILPTGIYFQGRDHHIGYVRPPIAFERAGRLRDDVATLTQLVTKELEVIIKRAPEQWHLFQPNWPSDPGYGS